MRALCSTFDPRIIRYQDEAEGSFVYCVWSSTPWSQCVPAQAMEVDWYYSSASVDFDWKVSSKLGLSKDWPVAIRIEFQELLECYGLKAPLSMLISVEGAESIISR